jgi:uncharacterized protein
MIGFPLRVWAGRWAVCRLAPEAEVPAWANAPAPLSVVARSKTELSVLVPEAQVPDLVTSERGFRVIEVVGPVPFAVTGLIASLSQPLSAAGISLFPVATYDTDYVLVKEPALAAAVDALRAAGFRVE